MIEEPAPVISRSALGELAAEVARARPWSEALVPALGRRAYERLRRDEQVEVWAIAWLPGHDTGFHDHDESAGALCVAEGTLVEDRLVLGGAPRSRELGPGEGVDFGPSHVHRVRCAGPGPAVSVHAYSPPLQRLGAYEVEPDGTLVRRPLRGDAELRAGAASG